MRRMLFLLSFALLLSACTAKINERASSIPSPVVESYPISFAQRLLVPGKPAASESAKARHDESALSVLIRTHSVQTKKYSFGDVAESIDGYSGGTDGRYWIFYVNGKMSDVGAGEYKIKDGDVIIWKFQKEGEAL